MQRALPATFCLILAVNLATAQTDSKAEVLKVEAAFNEAKLHNDVAALGRILADDYLAFNQWGAKRNKLAVIELFREFQTTSLVPTHVNVRVLGEVAVIDGVMKESSQEKYQFMRTYIKREGCWQLLSSAQTFLFNDDMKVLDPGAIVPIITI